MRIKSAKVSGIENLDIRGLFKQYSKEIIKIGLICIIILFAVVIRMSNRQDGAVIVEGSDEKTEIESTSDTETNNVPIYVDISGAVKSPGVYQVESDTRLFELIDMAGGLEDNAEIDNINQASIVADGEKIVIPEQGGDGATQGSTTLSDQQMSANNSVNINTADKEALMSIPGVGEVIADRIIEYRAGNRFTKIEDIKNVSGIGDATFEKMKDKITV